MSVAGVTTVEVSSRSWSAEALRAEGRSEEMWLLWWNRRKWMRLASERTIQDSCAESSA